MDDLYNPDLDTTPKHLVSAPRERFFEKVDIPDDPDACWVWTGAKTNFGYGHMKIDGKTHCAHRISVAIHQGPFPASLMVLHSCDKPWCVNPRHLRTGTQGENVNDSVERDRFKQRFGGDNHNTKLTEDQVLDIYRRAQAGESTTKLAAEYGVSRSTTSRIKTGQGRAYVTGQQYAPRKGLTAEQALDIYCRVWAGVKAADLAREYDLSPSVVSHIKHGRSWVHVTNHNPDNPGNPTLTRSQYERSPIPSRHALRLGRLTMTAAWTRKEGKNPKGGLNAKGRRSYPGTLRPPVKGAPKTPQEMRRKGSFLARAAGNPGPLKKPNGDPTRLLLSLRAWGASGKDDARRKSKRLLERYRKSQVKHTKNS